MPSYRERGSLFCLGLMVFLIQAFAGGLANGQPQAPSNIFFSQGQAVYHPEEPAKSRREALYDFQLQAIAQAAAVLLSPSQMGKQYPLIEEKILRQPQRYIQTYQIFSEAPAAGGLYRIAGQVAISMDLLKKDLAALPPAAPEGKVSPPAGPGLPGEGPAAPGAAGLAGRAGEPSSSRQEIFWAVAEKWEEDWVLPGDRRDPEGPFAASVFQELEAYGWSLHFSRPGVLTPDDDGEVEAGEALAQASALGLEHVVIGSVGLPDEKVAGETRVAASLLLLDTASGKDRGEIHREVPRGDQTSHEVAIELASILAPQLDRRLRSLAKPEAAAASDSSATGESTTTTEETFRPGEAGELVVLIQSPDAYSEWLAIEARLREHAPNLQVKGLDIGPRGNRVRLLGVDAAGLNKLDGTRLPSGAQVQVTSLGAEGHGLRITLTKPALTPAEQ